MDSTIIASISIALSVGSVLIGVINHKRIRSNCCGKKSEISLDIENTTPSSDKKESFDQEKKESAIV
jgi:hypothetical protein